MADQIIHEMVAAFAAGCMDKPNFIQFKDYMNDGGELPTGELGELQNIIAMLPIILDLETPDPAIKDMVAKKLIGMKDEIKAKIINERKTLAHTFTKAPTKEKTSGPPPLRHQPRTLTYQTKDSFNLPELKLSEVDFKKTVAKSDTVEKPTIKTDFRLPDEPAKKSTADELKIKTSLSALPSIEEPVKQTTSSSLSWVGPVAIILSLILFTILGYFSLSSISKLNDRVDELQNDLVSTKSELATANNFVNNYSSLIDFFNYKDVLVINLTSPTPEIKMSAKLLLSFNEKEGLIQFRTVQQLKPGENYQLWAVNKGQSYSLGNFQPVNNEYLKITFPFLPKEQIEEYKITIERGKDITTPSPSVFLTSLNSNPMPNRRGF